MSSSEVLEQPAAESAPQQRRVVNAIWQPFLQFKLLMYMLGLTAVVAVLLGVFLYYAFSDLIGTVAMESDSRSYYAEMIDIQLVYLFRYCGALFVLYVLLLAAVCIAYTHRLIGPFRPYTRHIDQLVKGDYTSRVNLRKGDLDMFVDFGEQLNELAAKLETQSKENK